MNTVKIAHNSDLIAKVSETSKIIGQASTVARLADPGSSNGWTWSKKSPRKRPENAPERGALFFAAKGQLPALCWDMHCRKGLMGCRAPACDIIGIMLTAKGWHGAVIPDRRSLADCA